MELRKTNRKNSNGCSLYEISVNEGRKMSQWMKYKEKGRQCYNYLKVYGVESLRNIYQVFFEDPLKNKMRWSI